MRYAQQINENLPSRLEYINTLEICSIEEKIALFFGSNLLLRERKVGLVWQNAWEVLPNARAAAGRQATFFLFVLLGSPCRTKFENFSRKIHLRISTLEASHWGASGQKRKGGWGKEFLPALFFSLFLVRMGGGRKFRGRPPQKPFKMPYL